MKKIGISLFSVLLLVIGSSAWAASIDLGTVSAGDLVGDAEIKLPGAFVDDWTFILTDDLLVSISVDANDTLPVFQISDFLVTSASPLINFDYHADDNRYFFTGPLPAGTYTFDATGTSAGSFGGSYIGTVGAVPLPAAAWLFGSAMLGLAAVGRRKKAAA